ncbi:unnamed protein product [Blumeria hordei]|uniref:Uncharacterized protein n=1 Tax=Blumeria hordei TaxID=2867405 RepID=A0A383UL92_BLUHO|nr:unnamed protein product [Blumeria hordei]
MNFLFSTLSGVIVGLLGLLHVQAATFECPFGRFFTSKDIFAAQSSRPAPDKVTYQNGHTINWYFLNRYTHNDEFVEVHGLIDITTKKEAPIASFAGRNWRLCSRGQRSAAQNSNDLRDFANSHFDYSYMTEDIRKALSD